MEAPDVIYLPKSLTATGVNRYCDWEEKPIPGYENIEYIRKEALLEWAKGMYELCSHEAEYHKSDSLSNGSKLAFKEVIDKINSM